ncbi:hypothetical protein HMPREF9555_02213 [Selenomonas artemidis F0399]|uniref:Uncharacterized protein n=1 Tax=Selenomonas artemidis F0399 TaxID=749551 RepID=E7N5B8_9FIRM|nr:hypothetical protein HMPREF9555_02213 [Selenomonas artemidis F0399]
MTTLILYLRFQTHRLSLKSLFHCRGIHRRCFGYLKSSASQYVKHKKDNPHGLSFLI